MRWLAAALLILLPALSWADESLPALYDVTGVASDDVLNIRHLPSASKGKIVGSFGFTATDIQVVSKTKDGWGLVNFNGETNWVSMRFLKRQPGQSLSTPPRIAQCFGTEPFWSLSMNRTRATLETPMGQLLSNAPYRSVRSSNRIDHSAIVGSGFVGTITRTSCSDGMSDYAYGFSIQLWLSDSQFLYSGCCSLI